MLSEDIIQEAEDIILNGSVDDLNPIGWGLFKNVYMLPSGRAVLKVMRDPTWVRAQISFEYEWAIYLTAHRIGSGSLFPDTIMGESERYGFYFIQEPCAVGDHYLDMKVYKEASYLGITDMHSGNIGLTDSDHRPVIVDWGFDYPRRDSIAEDVVFRVQEKRPLPQ